MGVSEEILRLKLITVTDVSDVAKNVKNIESLLGNIKLPSGLKEDFGNIFDKLTPELKKYQELFNKGFKTPGNLKDLEESGTKVSALVKRLATSFNDINANTAFKGLNIDFLSEDIAKATKEVGTFTKSLETATDIKLKDKGFTDLLDEIKKFTNSKFIKEFQDAFKTGDQEGMNKALNNLEKYSKSLSTVRNGNKSLGEAIQKIGVYLNDSFNNKAPNSIKDLSEKLKAANVDLNNLTQAEFTKLLQGLGIAKQDIEQFSEATYKTVDAEKKLAASQQQVNNSIDQMKSKIQYFFGLANAIQLVKRTLREAFDSVKELDKAMTDISVVTEFSVGDMWNTLPQYTKMANELGASTVGAYETMGLLYQQGLNTNEVMSMGAEIMKMARIANIEYADATDYMTSALRGFHMELTKTSATKVSDVYSKLAAISASDTEELAIAMSKVASLAANAGMGFENTAAFLAQMIEATREPAESLGTALKTIIARFNEMKKNPLEIVEVEGEEVSFNKIDTALKSVGISLKDVNGEFRNTDEVFLELSSKWKTLSKSQKAYIATTAAGSRQQSRFISMMANYDRTMELADAATNASGASQEQFQKTLDSLEAKLNQLTNAWNEFAMGIADESVIKGAVDALTNLLGIVNDLTGVFGEQKNFTKFGLAIAAALGGKGLFNKIIEGVKGESERFTNLGKNSGLGFLGGFGQSIKSGFKSIFKTTKIEPDLDFTKNLIPEDTFKQYQKTFTEGFKEQYEIDVLPKIISGEMDPSVAQEISASYSAMLEDTTPESVKVYAGSLKDANIELEKQGKFLEKNGVSLGNTKDKMYAVGSAAAGLGLALGLVGEAFARAGDKKAAENIGVISTALTVLGTVLTILPPLLSAFGFSVQAAMGPIGWIAAGITALVVVMNLVQNSFESADEKIERMNQRASDAKEAADAAKTAYDNLRTSIEGYASTQDAFDGLIKGTEEFEQALANANAKVIELLQLYPQLSEYLKTGEFGQSIISEEGLEKLKQWSTEAVKITQEEFFTSQANVVQAQIEKLEFEQARLEQMTGIYQDYEAEGKPLTERQTETYQKNIDELEEINKQIEELRKEAGKYYSQAVLGGIDSKALESNPYLGDIAKSVSERVDQFSEKIFAADTTGKQLEATRKSYEEEFGVKFFKDIGTEDAYRELYSYLTTGSTLISEEIQNLGIDEVKERLDEQVKLQNAIEVATSLSARLLGMKDQEGAGAFAALMSGGGGLTREQVNKLSEEGGLEALLASIFGTQDLEQVARMAQFEDFAAMEAYFNSVLKNTGDAFNTFLSDLSKKVGGFPRNLSLNLQQVIKGLNLEDQNIFGDVFSNIFLKGGDTAAKAFVDVFGTKIQNATPEVASKMIQGLSIYDLSSEQGLKDFVAYLNEIGVTISNIELGRLNEDFDYFWEIAGQIDLTKLNDQIATLLGLSKEIGAIEEGKGLTEEQRAKAIESGAATAKDFFFDGDSYIYIGGTNKELSQAMAQLGIAKVEEGTAEYESRIAKGEALKGLIETPEAKYDAQVAELQAGTLNAVGIKELLTGLGLGEFIKDLNQEQMASQALELLSSYFDLEQNKQGYETFQLREQQTAMSVMTPEEILKSNYGIEQQTIALKGLAEKAGITQYQIDELYEGFNSLNEAGKRDTNTLLAQAIAAKQAEVAYEAFQKAVAGDLKILNDKNAADSQQVESLNNIVKAVEELNDVKFDPEWIEANKQFFKDYAEGIPESAKFIKDNIDSLKDKDKELVESAKETTSKLIEEATKRARQTFSESLGVEISPLLDQENLNYIYEVLNSFDNWEVIPGVGLDYTEFINKLAILPGIGADTAAKIAKAMGLVLQLAPTGEYADYEMTYATYTPGDLAPKTDTVKIKQPIYAMAWVPTGSAGTSTTPAPTYTSPTTATGGTTKTPKETTPKETTPKDTSGGGGGEEEEPWENSFDKQYNLLADIAELQRERNLLEKQFSNLASDSAASASQLYFITKKQVESLEEEKGLQKDLITAKTQEMQDLISGSQFGSYAKYNWTDNTIDINWDLIESITDQDQGGDLSEYISNLEEIKGQIDTAEESLLDIQGSLQELLKRGQDEYLGIEDQSLNALIYYYQQIIDKFSETNQIVNNANSKLISAMEQAVNKIRQDRKNEETKKNLSSMERRLAYLRQDTSGANQFEILQLEDQLQGARQDYTDSLIDQKINEIQNQNQLAQEARERQIELMQNQLDWSEENGELWQDVYSLISSGLGPQGDLVKGSRLEELLQSAEGFKGLSEIGGMKWLEDLENTFEQALSYLGMNFQLEKLSRDKRPQTGADITFMNGLGEIITGKVLKNGDIDIGEGLKYTDVFRMPDGTYRTMETKPTEPPKATTPAPTTGGGGTGGFLGVGEQPGAESGEPTYYDWEYQTLKWSADFTDKVNGGYWSWDGPSSGTSNKYSSQNPPFGLPGGTQVSGWEYSGAIGGYRRKVKRFAKENEFAHKTDAKQYATGGIADYTGPAWLDGTKSRPELVLNQKDTQNFITLKDILSDIMNANSSDQGSGLNTNTFEVEINVDHISSDYDVDQMAARIKKIIYEDSSYRNINSINLLR